MLKIIEKAFSVLSIIILSGAIISLIETEANNVNSLIIKGIYIIIYIISLIFLMIKKDFPIKALKIFIKNKLLFMLILLIIFSFSWSNNLGITLQKIIAFLGTLIFSIYFCIRYESKEHIEIIAYAILFIIIVSIGIAFIAPDYGISYENNGAWQGAFNQKNVLGKIMTLGALVFLFYFADKKSVLNKTIALIGLISSLILIYLSQSKTAMLVVLLLSFTIISAVFLQKSDKTTKVLFAIIIGALIIISCVIIIYLGEDLLKSLNKDTTLTGRTELWSYSFNKIAERPLLGHGYASFWEKEKESPSYRAEYELGWDPPHAHNGFIDLTLELGFIGLIIILIQLFGIVLKACSYAKINKEFSSLWPLAMVSFIIFYNLTESSLMRPNTIFIVIYISLLYTLNKDKMQ